MYSYVTAMCSPQYVLSVDSLGNPGIWEGWLVTMAAPDLQSECKKVTSTTG